MRKYLKRKCNPLTKNHGRSGLQHLILKIRETKIGIPMIFWAIRWSTVVPKDVLFCRKVVYLNTHLCLCHGILIVRRVALSVYSKKVVFVSGEKKREEPQTKKRYTFFGANCHLYHIFTPIKSRVGGISVGGGWGV